MSAIEGTMPTPTHIINLALKEVLQLFGLAEASPPHQVSVREAIRWQTRLVSGAMRVVDEHERPMAIERRLSSLCPDKCTGP